MADSNFVLARGFNADAAIVKNRAVKKGTAAESVTPVTAAGDVVLGSRGVRLYCRRDS